MKNEISTFYNKKKNFKKKVYVYEFNFLYSKNKFKNIISDFRKL